MNTSHTSENTIQRPDPRTQAQGHAGPRMNLGILLVVVLLVCYGLLILFSASMTEGYASEGDPTFYVVKQAVITLAGVVVMIVLSRMNIRLFDRPFFFIVMYLVITLLLVLLHFSIPGVTITMNGATRWLELPGIPRFQPSELAKIGLVFCFAGYTSWVRRRKANRNSGMNNHRQPAGKRFFTDGMMEFVVPSFAIGVWLLLIVTQPHLSCAIILSGLAACCYFAAGFNWRVWFAGFLILMILILVVVIAFAFIVMPLMPADYLDQYDYWGRRINIFTNSEDASQDDLHQSEQSKIAIGSGGLTGVGLGQGRQKFNYLPEEFNDYVFAILAEELGLAGSMSVIVLFTALLLMGTAAAMKTSGPFPTIIIFGYTSLIAMQAFLNIGVAAGVLPPTGISLPLFSYGGTSNLFFLLGIGLLLGASRSGGAHPQTRRPSHA